MTDKKQILTMLARVGIVEVDDAALPYRKDNVYTAPGDSLLIRGLGYSGFYTELKFDDEGNLITWETWE